VNLLFLMFVRVSDIKSTHMIYSDKAVIMLCTYMLIAPSYTILSHTFADYSLHYKHHSKFYS